MRPTLRLFSAAIFLALFWLVPPSFSQEANQPALVPQASQGVMQEIAAQVAQKAKKAGCDTSKCVLLVTDFYTSAESTSVVGIKLSDEMATLLLKDLSIGTVVDRSTFRQYMNRARIPLSYLKADNAQRWLGRELEATMVLTGELDLSKGNNAIKFKILDWRPIQGKEWVGATLPPLNFKSEDLLTVEPYAPLGNFVSPMDGGITAKPSVVNTMPSCFYMPSPAVTDEAAQNKLSGSLLVDATITNDGKVGDIRIVHGLPFNTNEQALKTMQTWKCKPAVKNGQPIPARVQFSINIQIN
jgi:TonB family protein